MATTLRELLVYQKYNTLDVAVSVMVRRRSWGQNRTLRDQLAASVASIGANIEEGFEQPTDRAFAHYLCISKGSAAESAGHLRRAMTCGCLTAAEASPLVALAQEIARMLAGLIRHLRVSDYKDRGWHKAKAAGGD